VRGVEAQGATSQEFTASSGEMRLDQFLARQPLGLTRSQLARLVTSGHVLLNGRPAKPAQKLRPGDRISLTIPPPQKLELAAQAMPLAVVYQDAELIVLEKPVGLSVHPGPGHPDHTLVNALLALCPDIQGIGGAIRPGIVHRLDKDTSGLMMVAKTERAHQSLSAQIKERRVTKGYLALVTGIPPSTSGHIDAPIARDQRHRKRMAVVLGGREARTQYRVLEQFGKPPHSPPLLRGDTRGLGDYSLLEVYLDTGRTHQVRVHLAFLGHPLVGDALYGRGSPLLDRHFLHACHLGFHHPVTGEPMDFRSDLPDDLCQVLDRLKSSNQS